MALKNVDERGAFKTMGALTPNVGDSIAGFITGIVKGQYGFNFLFTTEAGEELTIGLPTNIQYKINDGKIQAGLYTVITREGDKKSKGKTAQTYRVEQDDERRVAVTVDVTAGGAISGNGGNTEEALLDAATISANDLPTTGTTGRSGNRNAGPTRADLERASIKGNAAKLRAQVEGN